MTLYRSIGARKDATRGTTAMEVRKDFAGLFSAPGVLPGAPTVLVEGTSGMAYRVHAAPWVTSRGGSDGVHLWGNDGDITVGTSGVGGTVPAAPGAGLKRIDIIYALHPSNGENADTTSEPTVAVVSGLAASTPIAPTLPAGALELARNEMSSGAVTTASGANVISQTAARVTIGGGLFPHRRLRSTSTIPTSTATTVTWLSNDTGEAVVGGLGYSSGVFTVSSGAAGYYTIAASLGWLWGTSVNGYTRVVIEVNSAAVAADACVKDAAAAAYVIASASVAAIYLKEGDTVRVRGTQNTGADRVLEETYSHMQISRIR